MMNDAFNFEKWRNRILEIRDQKTHNESLEFWNLVDMVHGANDAEITRTLLRTFSNKPDNGVKESVYNELGTVDFKLYYRIYFEELLNLIKETRLTEWYVLLASYPGGELTLDEWDDVIKIIESMDEDTQQTFKDIIGTEKFIDDNDWAEYVSGKLRKRKPHHSQGGK